MATRISAGGLRVNGLAGGAFHVRPARAARYAACISAFRCARACTDSAALPVDIPPPAPGRVVKVLRLVVRAVPLVRVVMRGRAARCAVGGRVSSSPGRHRPRSRPAPAAGRRCPAGGGCAHFSLAHRLVVSHREVLEGLLGCLASGVEVRVVALGQQAVLRLDLCLGRLATEPEQRVVVLAHHYTP
eukprot:CAMPEP_0179916516 /NCGR_PEP_ID=MMETSP0983-20121128/2297_1 /TAXON_ID=483367 /ORGANISM="non described non described, Strain CCMP 2436" /LENGTH=186 /DNA_ID=CAMNT_0021819101 /DNA_START=94 /DNA_END=653 /DNA_ORIENTATION=+